MSKQVQDAYIVAATRTPVGKAPRGVFRNVRPDDMLAHVLKNALRRRQAGSLVIDDVVVGCAMPEAEQGMNGRPHRYCSLIPQQRFGMTHQSLLFVGAQAVAIAADRSASRSRSHDRRRTESMSNSDAATKSPPTSRSFSRIKRRHRLRDGHHPARKSRSNGKSPRSPVPVRHRSHRRGARGDRKRQFGDEISPYTVPTNASPISSTTRWRPAPKLSAWTKVPRRHKTREVLAKLRPAFAANGTVTAGNSSQPRTSRGRYSCQRNGNQALQTCNRWDVFLFRSGRRAAEIMGIGPKFAIPKVLKSSGAETGRAGCDRVERGFRRRAWQ